MCNSNEDMIRYLIENNNEPLKFEGYVKNWPIAQWSLDNWSSNFDVKEVPFRCFKKDVVSDEPCWERRCKILKMKFCEFLKLVNCSEEWMYFDYKYLHQWFNSDSSLFKNLSWKQFGYPEKGPGESTLWVGSDGAHTPAHQDTYGVNVVAQLYGKKRWILFPPDTPGLKPTRVPYEESSVYSELNFHCPASLEPFKGLCGGRCVELASGDALLVPRGWWHYVQNIDPVSVAVNVWVPHEKDKSTLVSEALTKIFVAQICKDLPQETAKAIINPNEEDLADTPLSVLFLQLESVSNEYLDSRRKARRAKRQKTNEDARRADPINYDIKTILENPAFNIEVAKPISSEELVDLLNENLKKYVSDSCEEEDVDGSTSGLCLTRAVINAFTANNVVELIKQNLLQNMAS